MQGCKSSVAVSRNVRSELDTCVCRVEAEAVTGLEVVAGVFACCNSCTSIVVLTLNDIVSVWSTRKV